MVLTDTRQSIPIAKLLFISTVPPLRFWGESYHVPNPCGYLFDPIVNLLMDYSINKEKTLDLTPCPYDPSLGRASKLTINGWHRSMLPYNQKQFP